MNHAPIATSTRIVAATPGYFTLDSDENIENPEVYREPVLAWGIPDSGTGFIVPITFYGDTLSYKAVLYPDGSVRNAEWWGDGQTYASEQEWIAARLNWCHAQKAGAA